MHGIYVSVYSILALNIMKSSFYTLKATVYFFNYV